MKKYSTRSSYANMGLIGLMIAWLVFIVLVAIGWVINIIHLVHMTNILATGEGIVRVVGIFVFPLGAFMGWFF